MLLISVQDSSVVAEARRAAREMAEDAGFSEVRAGAVSIVVTEAANNLLRHAGGGQLQLRRTSDSAVEVVAVDRGRGMANAQACLADGYSTKGTSGTGLGAIRRASASFDVYSQVDRGTTLVSRIAITDEAAVGDRLGVMQTPAMGETVCGDAWAIAEEGSSAVLLVADGLGHGPLAAEAATAAVQSFARDPFIGPTALLERCHLALRSTRGAAVAVAAIDRVRGSVSYAGIGNITGVVSIGTQAVQMVSHNGTAGHHVRRIQEFQYSWRPGAALIMHSDGLGSQWNLSSYPGLQMRDPALIAATLCRDHTRGRDDVTVLAWKGGAP
ncbi:MAG TPA: ATP-binding protein [Bryobacteraceae bacterium]|nr:ATP-binding protein [Bryobacteraceae bacterium]